MQPEYSSSSDTSPTPTANYSQDQMSQFSAEVESGQRFEFGKNWSRFHECLNEERIQVAEDSLKEKLGLETLKGLRFLDAGCGSGLFSLAARRLGADVVSFDFDPNSVKCAQTLRDRFFSNDQQWRILSGSVLDEEFLESLGMFNITYCWGVLHHTGEMWKGMDLVSRTVLPGGQFYTMIYRDEGWKSKVWWHLKKFYCSGKIQSMIALSAFISYSATRKFLSDIFRFRNPMTFYREYYQRRGMSKYHDWVDWIGGFPFEVASAKQVIEFCGQRGFKLSVQDDQQYVFRLVESPDSGDESR